MYIYEYIFFQNNVLFETTLEDSVKVMFAAMHFLHSFAGFFFSIYRMLLQHFRFVKNYTKYSRMDGEKISSNRDDIYCGQLDS